MVMGRESTFERMARKRNEPWRKRKPYGKTIGARIDSVREDLECLGSHIMASHPKSYLYEFGGQLHEDFKLKYRNDSIVRDETSFEINYYGNYNQTLWDFRFCQNFIGDLYYSSEGYVYHPSNILWVGKEILRRITKGLPEESPVTQFRFRIAKDIKNYGIKGFQLDLLGIHMVALGEYTAIEYVEKEMRRRGNIDRLKGQGRKKP